MTSASLGSSFRVIVLVATFFIACGRTGLDGLPVDETGGMTGGLGGTGADGGTGGAGATVTGGSSFGGSSMGGSTTGGSSTGGTSTGGTSTGGTCVGTGPDFDFTIEPDQAVAYQIDPAHSGAQLARDIEPPLRELWRLDFDGPISYPIVADSRVFISRTSTDRYASRVYALDAATGETIWQSDEIMGDSGSSDIHLAFDRGVLFAMNEMGSVLAFEAARGDVRWRRHYDRARGERTIPIASGGALFLLGPTPMEFPKLDALDACDGSIVYSAGETGYGYPTLGDGLIFSSSACHETKAFDARTGNLVWQYSEGCFGGLGERSVFHDGALYTGNTNDGVIALDASRGDPLTALDAEFPAWIVSAAGDVLGHGHAAGRYVLNSFNPVDGSIRWSVAYPGDPALPLLLTPGYAWVLLGDVTGSRYLFAIDLASHEFAWQSPQPTVPASSAFPDDGFGSLQTIAAGGGRLFVSKLGALVAYAHDNGRTCGNGFLENGEACDDGNVDDGDYCSATCRQVTGECGDGMIQENESCDGSPTPASTACTDDCQLSFPGVMLAAGERHTCGLRRDGSVTCWGDISFMPGPPNDTFRYISANDSWAAGVLTDGSPVYWGSYDAVSDPRTYSKLEAAGEAHCGLSENGQLSCDGLSIPPPIRIYSELSAARDQVCALTGGGRLFCFAEGEGAAWAGSYRSVSVAQDGRICAIKDDRTLVCQQDLFPPRGEFIALSGGSTFWCGIRAGGTLACWGSLQSVLQPPAGRFAVIDAGTNHVCAVRVDGVTLCWGENDAGQATPPADFP